MVGRMVGIPQVGCIVDGQMVDSSGMVVDIQVRIVCHRNVDHRGIQQLWLCHWVQLLEMLL